MFFWCHFMWITRKRKKKKKKWPTKKLHPKKPSFFLSDQKLEFRVNFLAKSQKKRIFSPKMIVFYVFFAVSGRYVFFLAYFHKKITNFIFGAVWGLICVARGDQKCWFSAILPFSGLRDPGYSQVLFFWLEVTLLTYKRWNGGSKPLRTDFQGARGAKPAKNHRKWPKWAKTLFFTALINFLLNICG